MTDIDHIAMTAALKEAEKARQRGEVPIGAALVDVRTGEIVATDGNRTIELSDPTAHAEIMVIRQTAKQQNAQRLPEFDLYVTVEPCPMCAAALSYARIRRVVYGARDEKSGGISTGPALYTHSQLHHKPEIVSGIMADDCAKIITDFFREKRASGKI